MIFKREIYSNNMNKKRLLVFLLIITSIAMILLKSSNLTTGFSIFHSSLFFPNFWQILIGTFLILVGAGLFVQSNNNHVVSSRVKKDSLLLKIAEEVGRKQDISRDINHLIYQLNQGNLNPGLGTKSVSQNVRELRGRNGGRVYYREIEKGKYELLGYSDKGTQERVIRRLGELYD